MITKIKTKSNRDGELTVNGLCSLMVKENKITKAAEIKTEPTAPNINDQIAEFFKFFILNLVKKSFKKHIRLIITRGDKIC